MCVCVCACVHARAQVLWVPLQRKADLGVLSACSQGKVLLWRLEAEQRALVLLADFTLEPQQLPQSLKVTRTCPPSLQPLTRPVWLRHRLGAVSRWACPLWRRRPATRTPSWWARRGACCSDAASPPQRPPVAAARRPSSPSGVPAAPSTPSTPPLSTGQSSAHAPNARAPRPLTPSSGRQEAVCERGERGPGPRALGAAERAAALARGVRLLRAPGAVVSQQAAGVRRRHGRR